MVIGPFGASRPLTSGKTLPAMRPRSSTLSVILMMVVSGYVQRFVTKHPTIKVLALSFLMMIGLVLIAEGFEVEVPKGYVYFAMTFAVFVELMNMRLRKVSQPAVTLHEAYVKNEDRKTP